MVKQYCYYIWKQYCQNRQHCEQCCHNIVHHVVKIDNIVSNIITILLFCQYCRPCCNQSRRRLVMYYWHFHAHAAIGVIYIHPKLPLSFECAKPAMALEWIHTPSSDIGMYLQLLLSFACIDNCLLSFTCAHDWNMSFVCTCIIQG